MFLEAFYVNRGDVVRISAEQASRFAKEVAGDFNPIHDPDARRFCVPGDLLVALVLHFYGLSERMEIRFRGMVGDDVPLVFPETSADTFAIASAEGKVYIEIERHGERVRDERVVEAFIRRYSAFSGRNFPEFLEPLMREQGVMFNPDRPLVLYDSMSFELDAAPTAGVDMELQGATLGVDGKRGDEWVRFTIADGGKVVGQGAKRVVISGLQPWDESRIGPFIENYTAVRDRFSR